MAYTPYMRSRYTRPNYGYGQQEQQDVLQAIAQKIYEAHQEREAQQRAQAQTVAMTAPAAQALYDRGAPSPPVETLSPLGRFTDMGMRAHAAWSGAPQAVQARNTLRDIMETIRRGTNDQGAKVATLPSGATITDRMGAPVYPGVSQPNDSITTYPSPTDEEFKARGQAAFAPTVMPLPTMATELAGPPVTPVVSRVLDSPYGTGSGTYGMRDHESMINGLPSSEWFQRAANAGGANAFARPEPGYQGVPFYAPGTAGYGAWEQATAKFRKPKAA